MLFPGLIIQKFGGATLADPAKIQHAARRVTELSKKHPLIVVVSAMGKTTDSLIDLARQVSRTPHRREMDMLLSVGERMSMSLLSMALNDLGCPAISFTGSQAGIMTCDSHVNAFIQDVRPIRVVEALQRKQVVILAGFQGVSPKTKEITTLGRGGSDTTAMAMAAHFRAERCDILKEVSSVFTADPRRVGSAQALSRLSYQQLADMTFWGAKVLHYRSAELALTHKVPLYIGPAADKATDFKQGTLMSEDNMFFESGHFLAVNSHDHVLVLESKSSNWHSALLEIKNFLESCQIPLLQVLQTQMKKNRFEIWLTGPSELTQAARAELGKQKSISVDPRRLSTVTLTCTGSVSPTIYDKISAQLGETPVCALLCQSNNLTLLIESQFQDLAIKNLHRLIESQAP